ncbi:MAG: hypothetical protein JJ908_09465 [Rhizobiales bacterium]|nr:hypothetical protein [Hyphomicrobiales bacterium]MBO6699048.1 hypothetical protein [Hyphomicrobiales bacterium]MBO6736586.1 hypothetical protein [Hyphomicrobiales bacterium]MBO6912340.1 hypothetical protein [Hyphomicrobiales bacterium]MBO6956297.1 hypothetical protein [Hyphomicrobiales bacterium]
MMMAPVSSTSPASQAAPSGQSVASAGSRVAPVAQSSALAGLVAGASMAGTGAPASGQPQQISAQALLTLLQTLGKPLSGSVGQPAPGGSGGAQSSLPLTLSLPQGATGSPASTVQTSLPLPAGTTPPPSGTQVLVQAEGGANAPRLGVTVSSAAQTSPSVVRADAARQSSFAPLLADVAKLTGQPSLPKGLDAALGRIMGFALDADAPIDSTTLKSVVEGARSGLASSTAISTGGPQPAQTPMQTALGALVRALGLAMPDGDGKPTPQASQATSSSSNNTAQQPHPNAPGKSAGQPATPPPLPNGAQPSRLLAHPLPLDAPDLTDPSVLQTLKGKAEAALSRLNLLQAGGDTGNQRVGDTGPALRWDVPLLIGQEAAVLGVAIDRDGGSENDRDDRLTSWRFRFAFESQALGGVEGLVALHQTPAKIDAEPHLDIAVWAHEPSVLARLDSSRVALVERLQALGLVIDSLTLAPAEDMPSDPAPSENIQHRVDMSS